jgi:hypothetical protein
MPFNIETNLKTVIDKFTPDILGVFWITKEELSRDLLGFDEFNYLFDGLISQYLYGQKEDANEINIHKSNIFFTRNFNQNIFLIHCEMNADLGKALDDQMALILENNSSERKRILIFTPTLSSLSSDLQDRYPKFEFIDLELSKEERKYK